MLLSKNIESTVEKEEDHLSRGKEQDNEDNEEG